MEPASDGDHRRTRQSVPLERRPISHVALVGYAVFATVAGAPVVVDGPKTTSHSGHDV